MKESPAPAAVWLDKKRILTVCNVGERRLIELADKGHVRRVKLDPAKQGRTLYNVSDLTSCVERLAAGLPLAVPSCRAPRARKAAREVRP